MHTKKTIKTCKQNPVCVKKKVKCGTPCKCVQTAERHLPDVLTASLRITAYFIIYEAFSLNVFSVYRCSDWWSYKTAGGVIAPQRIGWSIATFGLSASTLAPLQCNVCRTWPLGLSLNWITGHTSSQRYKVFTQFSVKDSANWVQNRHHDDDDDEGRINFGVALSSKTTRTRNNKLKQWSHVILVSAMRRS